MKQVLIGSMATGAFVCLQPAYAKQPNQIAAEVCDRPISEAISRTEVARRVKLASSFRAKDGEASRLQALGVNLNKTLLIRLPAIESIYAGSKVPTFSPITEECQYIPDNVRNFSILGQKSVGRNAIATCLRISRRGEIQTSYEATNVFGANVKVQRLRFENVSIFMGMLNPSGFEHRYSSDSFGQPSNVGLWVQPREMDDPLRMPMAQSQLNKWRKFGAKYILVKLRPPYAYSTFGGTNATYLSPTQITDLGYGLVGDVTCISAINKTDTFNGMMVKLPMSIAEARQQSQANTEPANADDWD